MRAKLYLIFFVLLLSCKLHAQVSYSFSAVSSPYANISGTIVALDDLSGYGALEEGHKNGLPIGFTFNYNGTAYSTIGVSANGFAYFGAISDADAANAAYLNGLKDFMPTCRPIIAPFWEDAKYGSNDKVSYLTSGTAPNRIFTLQWTDMLLGWHNNPTPTPSFNMQVKLYENTNVIEFAYSQIPGGLVGDIGSGGSEGASIGLSALATGTNNFLSLSNSGSSPSASSVTETSTIDLRPATNQVYRFTPTFESTLPVTFANFKAVKNNAAVNLSWTTFTEINNKGFEIEKSLDGRKFEKIGFAPTLAKNGSSSNTINYSYKDLNLGNFNSFYRFKQVDYDGKFVYSPVVAVKTINPATIQVSNVYPNPAQNTLSIIVRSPSTQNLQLSITDLSGKVINQRTSKLIVGDNFFPLNIANLSQGMYFIKLYAADKTQLDCIKFIKQ